MLPQEFSGGQVWVTARSAEEIAERREVGWALEEAHWEAVNFAYGNAEYIIASVRRDLEPRFGRPMFSGEIEVLVEPDGNVALVMKDENEELSLLRYGHLNESNPVLLTAFINRIQNAFALRVLEASKLQYQTWQASHRAQGMHSAPGTEA